MKNKFPLIVALIIGVGALLAIRQYVNKMEQEAAAKLKGELVVAASVDIPAGTELTMQMISPKEVPPQFIPAQAIQGSDQVKQILGRKARVAVTAGQIILWSDLASETRGGLSSIIPEGEGAFTVSIAKGIKPGLIQPSDHIDIIASFAIPKPNQPLPTDANAAASWREVSDVVNVVVLQNVTVLAVGDTFGGGVKSQNESGGDLTLSLTLSEAQLVMFAGQNGELGAVLRREGSTTFTPADQRQRVTFEAIEKIVGDLDGKRNYRNVEVQKGSQSTSVPVSNH
ncbi:MAG: Flp pilus assembly protein CpaB [Verrucomicrobiae bacterium]|nr:Flp pilus assembly protein CpaB [Verrucomicrobiae bacterium]